MTERENKYMLSGTVELDDTYVGAPTNGKPQYLKMESLENLKGIAIGKYANKHIEEDSII